MKILQLENSIHQVKLIYRQHHNGAENTSANRQPWESHRLKNAFSTHHINYNSKN